MNIVECHAFLNSYIDKYSGAYFSPEDLDRAINEGQLDLFRELLPNYALNQDVKDMLSPFKDKYVFVEADSTGGLVTVPEEDNYQRLLELSINYVADGATRYEGVKVLNDDELAKRLKSQTNPVSATKPVAEQMDLGSFQLYPKQTYKGEVRYLRLPIAPVFGYDDSTRVPVYDDATSVQPEWRSIDMKLVLLKALAALGVNIGDGEVVQYAEQKQNNG